MDKDFAGVRSRGTNGKDGYPKCLSHGPSPPSRLMALGYALGRAGIRGRSLTVRFEVGSEDLQCQGRQPGMDSPGARCTAFVALPGLHHLWSARLRRVSVNLQLLLQSADTWGPDSRAEGGGSGFIVGVPGDTHRHGLRGAQAPERQIGEAASPSQRAAPKEEVHKEGVAVNCRATPACSHSGQAGKDIPTTSVRPEHYGQ